MTPEANNPQMLDVEIYNAFVKAAKKNDQKKMLALLNAASASLKRNPYTGDYAGISVGTILTIMTDSVRILTGDIESIARTFSWPFMDAQRSWRIAEEWQGWVHSLEHLAIVAGVELGPLPAALHEEFAEVDGKHRAPNQTERLLKLWRASRPFMFLWLNHGLLNRDNDPNDLQSYDEHVASLAGIMSYAYGLRENWPAAANARWEAEVDFIKSEIRISPGELLSQWSNWD
ncbi:hypothetical protein IWX65_003175 [Arthrobacter sp. CAN_A214]|uniref:hypothetical protein n=1 Tax=Arthrobacter sp. CAN_A214 TaxID=2787720 RepID=UPI0018CBD234